MKIIKIISMLTLVVASMTSTSTFAGDVAAGKAKSVVCGACHGADGKALQPIYPNLAGQNEAYLISSMKAYKAGQRSGGQAAIMTGMAASLSDADIANLAAYYSSLK